MASSQAAHLGLPPALQCIHPVFHVSFLQSASISLIPNIFKDPLPPLKVDDSNEYEVLWIPESKINQCRKGSSVMFCNTHSIFADIIQAEIFEPNLSNSIPDSLHIFTRFCALPAILTFSGTFSPHSTCYPSTLSPITSFNNSHSYCI